MIRHESFRHDPWGVREVSLDLSVLAQSESVFSLANGHLGWRGTLDEANPQGLPGTYLNGVFERRPLSYAEWGYGYPAEDEVVVNVANARVIGLVVGGSPLDVRQGTLHSHERFLDFRAGTLERHVDWSSPEGRRVRVHSTRLVSLVDPAIGAVRYVVEAVGAASRVRVQSDLVANEAVPVDADDPRGQSGAGAPARPLAHGGDGSRVDLVHRTEVTGLVVAAAADHDVIGPPGARVTCESGPDLGRVVVEVDLGPGQRLEVVTYAAHAWSGADPAEELRARVIDAAGRARARGFDAWAADQRALLDEFWARSDLELDGDDEVNQAARFSLFHVLQSGAALRGRGVAAKGLTGSGYDGHAFWDTESFVLPVLSYTLPEAAGEALAWRHSTLATARERAASLGLAGAAFPWRTISGAESSAYWPAGTAAFHVSADVSDAVLRYLDATEDRDFERGPGLEVLVETARLWMSLGHHGGDGRFHVDGVTGPDEYSAVADDNVYTNLMAARNLGGAARSAARHPDRARELGVDDAEAARWRAAADAIAVNDPDERGVTPQSRGFTEHALWDFAATPPGDYPLLLHHPYFDLYRRQVVKQADLVFAQFRFADRFSDAQRSADFSYYEAITVRDSSLSACVQSIAAAQAGHLDLAYDYLADAALMDLEDLEHNTRNGLHIACLAGTWLALVAGMGGMRDHDGALRFAPRLPEGITRLSFGITYRGRRLRVEARPAETTYRLDHGDPVDVEHFGDALTLGPDPVTAANRPGAPAGSRPRQPVGREPARRVPPPREEHP